MFLRRVHKSLPNYVVHTLLQQIKVLKVCAQSDFAPTSMYGEVRWIGSCGSWNTPAAHSTRQQLLFVMFAFYVCKICFIFIVWTNDRELWKYPTRETDRVRALALGVAVYASYAFACWLAALCVHFAQTVTGALNSNLTKNQSANHRNRQLHKFHIGARQWLISQPRGQCWIARIALTLRVLIGESHLDAVRVRAGVRVNRMRFAR